MKRLSHTNISSQWQSSLKDITEYIANLHEIHLSLNNVITNINDDNKATLLPLFFQLLRSFHDVSWQLYNAAAHLGSLDYIMLSNELISKMKNIYDTSSFEEIRLKEVVTLWDD